MKTANQQLFDLQVEHLIASRRYENSTNRLIEEASKRHRSWLARLVGAEKVEDKAVRTEIQRYVGELYATADNSITDYLGAELDFQTKALRKVVGDFYEPTLPSRAELAARIRKTPLRLGGQSYNVLSKSFEGVNQAQYARVSTLIRRGIAEGTSKSDLVAQVVKSAKLSETQAKTLVSTNLSQAETFAKQALVAANPALLSGLVFTAILDSRTSTTCSSYDGLFQSVDNVKVQPPLHYNCRSKLIPVLKSKEQLVGVEGVDQEALAAQEPGYLSGALPFKENFGDWLRRQTVADQVKHLGSEEKAALFQKGTLSISDFFSATGNSVSIATLRTLDNLATFFTPTRQRQKATPLAALEGVSRPHRLLQSKDVRKGLEDLYIQIGRAHV